CALPEGNTGTTGTCNGTLYSVSGPMLFGATFDSSKVNIKNIGTLQVAFQDASNATMTWVVNPECYPQCLAPSFTRTVAITRQLFATGAAPSIDYTDLWWNPNESGWALAITQQARVMFLAWYVYDRAGLP